MHITVWFAVGLWCTGKRAEKPPLRLARGYSSTEMKRSGRPRVVRRHGGFETRSKRPDLSLCFETLLVAQDALPLQSAQLPVELIARVDRVVHVSVLIAVFSFRPLHARCTALRAGRQLKHRTFCHGSPPPSACATQAPVALITSRCEGSANRPMTCGREDFRPPCSFARNTPRPALPSTSQLHPRRPKVQRPIRSARTRTRRKIGRRHYAVNGGVA